jgi:hypothetical protein
MGERRLATLVCLLGVWGCGGTASGATGTDASLIADGTSGSMSEGGVCPSDSASCATSDGSVDAGTSAEAGTSGPTLDGGGALDAEAPDAPFPGSCDQFSFELTPDAAPGTCAFTPADVACNTDDDCKPYTKEGCGCIEPVYGVNKTSTANCPALPCSPPFVPCQTSGFGAQDCQVVPMFAQVGVSCVAHECRSFALLAN